MKRIVIHLMLFVLCTVLLCGLIPAAQAAPAITYVDEKGAAHTITDYYHVTDDTTVLTEGVWFAADLIRQENTKIRLSGDVTLILNHSLVCDGIWMGNNDLTIYKAQGSSGSLTAANSGISGYGTLTLCSGEVISTALPTSYNAAFCGEAGTYIKGGSLTACGDNYGAVGGKGPVIISGGSVTAYGAQESAAIGGARYQAADITITGGTVKALGSSFSVAIGNGYYGSGGSVTITGGKVHASSVLCAIGGGITDSLQARNSGPITITGGQVTAEVTDPGHSGICTHFKSGGLTLGWSSLNDRITGNFCSGDYHPQKVTLQNYFWLGSVGTAATAGNLDGRTLIPSADRNLYTARFFTRNDTENPWRVQTPAVNDPGDPYTDDESVRFLGWKIGSFGGSAYSFNSGLTEDVDLYAGYQSAVTLDFGNGDQPQTVYVDYGNTLPRPADPVYSAGEIAFLGWHRTGESSDYDFSAPVNEPFTLEARWDFPGITYTGGYTVDYTEMQNLLDATLTTGDYVVTEDTTIDSRLTVSGTVNLILTDGTTLTVPKGIRVNGDNALNIYGQSGGTGMLRITSPDRQHAGIGCEDYTKSAGKITIYGGTLDVRGGYEAAGIGGGYWGGEANIAIHGGTVNVKSGTEGTAIGSSTHNDKNQHTTILITGGNITARGDVAGIGGGTLTRTNHSLSVTITGGTVTAYGGWASAAIGGGCYEEGVSVRITGGNVTAFNDEEGGSGIGPGKFGSGSFNIAWAGNPIYINADSMSAVTFEDSFMDQDTGELITAANLSGRTMVRCYGVNYAANGGTGEMAGTAVPIGGLYTVPESDFTPPEGQAFAGWMTDSGEVSPGAEIELKGDLCLTAHWRNVQPLSFASVTEDEPEGAMTVHYGDAPFTNALSGAQTAVTWMSSDTTVATVNENGLVTITGVGTAVIRASAAQTEDYSPAEAAYTLTVEKKTVETPVVTAEGEYMYTGEAVIPTVTVRDGNTVIPSDEYEVTLSDNLLPGTASVSVTAPEDSHYILSAEATFEIACRPVVISGITAKDRHYDETDYAELDFSGVSIEGLVAGDVLKVTADGAFADAESGDGKEVTISNLTLSGMDGYKYVLAEDGQQTLTSADIYAPHLVRFRDEDGTALSGFSEQNVLNGECAGEPEVTDANRPVREGFRFVGWNLDGELFDFSAPLSFDTHAEITLTPRFMRLYTVSGIAGMEGSSQGSFTWELDAQGETSASIQAVEGDVLSVYATPDEGYALRDFSIYFQVAGDGGETETVYVGHVMIGDGAAEFTMPAADVYITGAFVLEDNVLAALYNDSTGHYEVGSVADLMALNRWMTEKGDDADPPANMQDETVDLTADLNLSGSGFGGFGHAFSGTFNGGEHTLSGVSFSGKNSAGFFPRVDGTVRDLTLKGTSSVSGGTYVGSIATVGGIACEVGEGGSILNCVSLVRVSGGYYAQIGGIAGSSEGTVSGCCYLGMGGQWNKTAVSAVGSGTAASGCTALYSVQGDAEAYGGSTSVLSAESEGNKVDGWFRAGSDVILTLSGEELDGWTLEGFKYQDADYNDVNLTDNHDGTWTLADIGMNVTITTNYSYDGLSGLDRDSQNRYLIRTKADLQAVAAAVDELGGCGDMGFALANDLIDVGSFSGIAVGTEDSFSGTFDGCGHKISGMNIVSGADNVGFIGYLGGTLTNLTLENCTVTGRGSGAYVGMLAGSADYGTLSGCRVYGGTVRGEYAGAISGSGATEDNLYTPDVSVYAAGELVAPGSCGTSQGDLNYSGIRAAAVAWRVSFVDGFDGATELAPAQLVADSSAAEVPSITDIPVHDHFTFTETWQRADGTEYCFNAVYAEDSITADTVLYPIWEEEASWTVTLDYGTALVTTDSLPVYQSVAAAGYALPDCPVTPPTGNAFAGWQIAGSSYAAGDTLVFGENITLTALWQPAEYSITAETPEHGTVSVPAAAAYGAAVTVDLIPEDGSAAESLTWQTENTEPAEITAADGVYSFTMPAEDVILTAVFRQLDYTVTVSGSLAHGALWTGTDQVTDLSTPVTVHAGDRIAINPDAGWKVASLTVTADAGSNPEAEENSFEMPAANVTLTAVFEADVIFGTPDFTLPAAIRTVEEYAFEGAAMTVAYIPDGCTAVGAYAFKDCKQLTKIRIPKGCTVDKLAFDGCGTVLLFSADPTMETYCLNHESCVYIGEDS